MLYEFHTEEKLVSLIEQLINIEKIPHEIISKYWIRAYTVESNFYRKMNKDLRQSNTNNYLTYIQMMYEAIKIKSFPINKSKYLYRGTYFTYKEINILRKYITNKIQGLPGALVYCRGFFSFSLLKEVSLNFMYFQDNSENMIPVLLIIDNNNEDSISHSSSSYIKKFSAIKKEEEVLFFPFSCFEVKNIEKSTNNYYIINLNYLGKYDQLFKGKKPDELIKLVPENSNLAHDIFKSRIIKEEYTTYVPNWGQQYYHNKFYRFASNTMQNAYAMAETSYNTVKDMGSTIMSVFGSVVSAPFKLLSSTLSILENANFNNNYNYL